MMIGSEELLNDAVTTIAEAIASAPVDDGGDACNEEHQDCESYEDPKEDGMQLESEIDGASNEFCEAWWNLCVNVTNHYREHDIAVHIGVGAASEPSGVGIDIEVGLETLSEFGDFAGVRLDIDECLISQ